MHEPRSHPLAGAAILGLLHALVDATSLALLYHEVALGRFSHDVLCQMVLGYNVLAFGLQAPLGWISDRLGRRSLMAAAGTALAAVAVLLAPAHPFAATAVVGMGNALFHAGAGAVVLRQSGGRAADAGVFVAPGALGVWVGIWLGTHEGFDRALPALALLAATVLLTRVDDPEPEPLPSPEPRFSLVLPCALALLGSVVVRSLAGGAFNGAWSGHGPWMALALALGAVVGKGVGGFLADRAGWRMLAVGSLLCLWPLSGRALQEPGTAVLAMLLIQLSMPVTLTALYRLLPDRPGLAMGLPSMALLLGALPAQGEGLPLDPAPWLGLLIPVSAALAWAGLGFRVQRSRSSCSSPA